jgi:hypothetical protein
VSSVLAILIALEEQTHVCFVQLAVRVVQILSIAKHAHLDLSKPTQRVVNVLLVLLVKGTQLYVWLVQQATSLYQGHINAQHVLWDAAVAMIIVLARNVSQDLS